MSRASRRHHAPAVGAASGSVGNRAFAHWLAERPDPADLATQIDASTSLLGELAYLMLQAEGVP